MRTGTIAAGLAFAVGIMAQNEIVTEYASVVTVGYDASLSTSSPTTLSTITRAKAAAVTQSASPTITVAYNGTEGNPGAGGTSGGASGADNSSFSLSQGGIIAIAVVCAAVIIIGIASTVLYVIAKRRQWDVRGSIRRASRRITGRAPPSDPRRQGMHKPIPMADAKYGQKRGLVVNVNPVPRTNQVLQGKAPTNTRPREKTWMKGLWGGTWK